uniref:FH1/FH2 domain-containing protein 3 n=1 Tax=Cacopsylla melanoneura TaxID=428564 RepID=A0A8D9ALW7_9HEMI
MLDTDDLLSFRVQYVNDCDPFSVYQSPEPTVPQLYKFSSSIPLVHQISALHRYLRAPHKLDDATIQLYKDGDFGSYLDLEQSIAEQSEDFEGFGNNRHNSIILRTQLSVRVHNILEKLYSSEGKDLRRALFSLKQIFQADKDLVHEFVQNDGLTCLVKVGTEADQNHQNYILRALGQVMLYVDGMTGIMEHPPTVQWLYCLVASKFRLVIKTALKLLLIFVEYVESNCFLLIQAVHAVDNSNGEPPWSNIMRLLTDRDSTDTELLRYAMSLLNKTLNGIPDQDSYYDQVDALEEQGIAIVIRRYMSKQGTDLDLLRQFQIYEAVLLHEDGEDKGTPLRQLDEAIRKTLRNRKSLTPALNNNVERRKSRRFSTNSQPTLYTPITNIYHHNNNNHIIQDSPSDDTATDRDLTPAYKRRRERRERQHKLSREQKCHPVDINSIVLSKDLAKFPSQDEDHQMSNGHSKHVSSPPSVPKRHVENVSNGQHMSNGNSPVSNGHVSNGTSPPVSKRHVPELLNGHISNGHLSNGHLSSSNLSNGDAVPNGQLSNINGQSLSARSPVDRMQLKADLSQDTGSTDSDKSKSHKSGYVSNGHLLKGSNGHLSDRSNGHLSNGSNGNISNGSNGHLSNGHHSDQSLSNGHSPSYPPEGHISSMNYPSDGHLSNGHVISDSHLEPSSLSNVQGSDGRGHISNSNGYGSSDNILSSDENTSLKNKRECSVKDLTQKLSNLHSPSDKLNTNNSMVGEMKGIISKAKEGLAKSQSRGELKSPTVDSPGPKMPEIKKSETDLHWEELLKSTTKVLVLCDLDFSDLHSDEDRDILAPTHVANGVPPPPPPCGVPPPQPMGMGAPPPVPNMVGGNTLTGNKTKKTVKLFWKEVREDPIVISKLKSSLIWDELSPVKVDTQKLEHLFESRAKDLISKKQHELNKHKEVIVLDPKRSNAINIAMTKLPPPRSIRTAILKMDSTVVNREGIEKLLSMLPTDEEKCKILEAVSANPGVPLGSAENFLLELSNINELVARLKLWAFKLDYDNLEREVAEPLMDLKQGMDILQRNPTFKAILSTLLSIGIFLNGTEVKGFQIDYLTKVPEVKDTVHKHSLLHHLCDLVLHQFPQSTDLYSEIGPVTRASKVDFDELASSLHRMETECKASFDHLKLIIKHDGSATQVKVKMSEFLSDTAQRIIILGIVHRRVLHRFHRFSLWLGIPLHRAPLTKPQDLMRIISEFALEYRTTRERVIQTREKKANHRERNKTRGKMITEVSKMRSQEDRADAELRQLLEPENTDPATQLNGTLTWRPRRKESVFNQSLNGTLGDGQEDELLESLVKTATKIPAPRTVPRERKRTRHADRKSLVKRSRTRDNMPENNNVYLSESAS